MGMNHAGSPQPGKVTCTDEPRGLTAATAGLVQRKAANKEHASSQSSVSISVTQIVDRWRVFREEH
jgi:hypothetical protein